ncbi:MAG: DUF4400 domain-containing protein [Cellvibrionaceae bacterium]|nr:DUF4400 domain-containing protein [Cellvibrionaceae bacterium]
MNTPLWLAMWIIAIEAIIVTTLVPGDWTAKVIAEESALLETRLGSQEHRWVHGKARHWFNISLIDSGIYGAVRNHILPTAAQKNTSVGMQNMASPWFNWVDQRLQATVNSYYHILARFALLYTWTPYFLILLVPAVFDGFITWRIKRTNFDYPSPLLHQYSTLGIGYVLIVLVALFLAPIVLDPIVIPAAIMLICVMAGLMIGNLQKRI